MAGGIEAYRLEPALEVAAAALLWAAALLHIHTHWHWHWHSL